MEWQPTTGKPLSDVPLIGVYFADVRLFVCFHVLLIASLLGGSDYKNKQTY